MTHSRDTFPAIAITSGEPAGIGPELCATLLGHGYPARIALLGDVALLRQRAGCAGIDLAGVPVLDGGAAWPGEARLAVLPAPLRAPCSAGLLDARNGGYVLSLLDRALQGCMNGEFAAMVTAPVHKGVINDGGVPFSGHTEYLAEHSGTARVVMMLVGGGLRVALATTHLPLKDVSSVLTQADLETTIRILHSDLRDHFGVAEPRILVAGLNPHAGEGGYLGREEIEVIAPVLERLRAEGMRLIGPLPADTLFTRHQLAQADCQLTMFHDQGLPTLKYASFGGGVNVTLGLPFIRTSVDHGTALDLAGTGRADAGSLRAAVELAIELAGYREKACS